MISDQPFAAQLTAVFRDVFDEPSLNLTDELTANDIAAWDSLTHIDLIHAIEKTFKIRFSIAEVTKLKNVGELAALIRRKIG